MGIPITKQVLSLCVLSLLRVRDMYGYEIVSAISMEAELSEGAVYPLLKRFRADGWVTAYLTESREGPPRKYYALTDKGREVCDRLRGEWQRHTAHINAIIERGERTNNGTR